MNVIIIIICNNSSPVVSKVENYAGDLFTQTCIFKIGSCCYSRFTMTKNYVVYSPYKSKGKHGPLKIIMRKSKH